MSSSSPYIEFLKSLELAKELISLDTYGDPPSPNNRNIVQGLRGGAAILMVASFEYFINTLHEFHFIILTQNHTHLEYDNLPQKMQVQNVYGTLSTAMNTPQGPDSRKIHRLEAIYTAMESILEKRINIKAFTLQGIPKSSKILRIFNFLNIDDIFRKITDEFQIKWSIEVPTQFIKDKLDEIVNRRNIVAHTSNTLNITKSMLNEGLKFLQILAELLNNIYKNKIHQIYTKACIT